MPTAGSLDLPSFGATVGHRAGAGGSAQWRGEQRHHARAARKAGAALRDVSTGVDSAPRGIDRPRLQVPHRPAACSCERRLRREGGTRAGGSLRSRGARAGGRGGRGRGRAACEPGSGRLGRAGPVCTLAGGRPKGGGLWALRAAGLRGERAGHEGRAQAHARSAIARRAERRPRSPRWHSRYGTRRRRCSALPRSVRAESVADRRAPWPSRTWLHISQR